VPRRSEGGGRGSACIAAEELRRGTRDGGHTHADQRRVARAVGPHGEGPATAGTRRTGRAQVELASWIGGNRDVLAGHLQQVGAVLFRGFQVATVGDFESTVRAYSPNLLDYREGSTPRHLVSGKIYSSTEYPPERTIPLHPELAYSHYWPRTLWFCCIKAPAHGGATPLADNRRILRRLDPAVRERFARLGIRYVRTYRDGFDIPWQNVFQTRERKVVDEYCRRVGISCQWHADGVLRTEQVSASEVRHPVTGEHLWFNQVLAWHISALEPAVQTAILATFGADDLPRNVCFGDGTPIGPDEITAIRSAHEQAMVSFPWQQGDALLIDNMLVAHGRQPYAGERRVVVAMSDQYDRSQLRAAMDRLPVRAPPALARAALGLHDPGDRVPRLTRVRTGLTLAADGPDLRAG
jgi:hypothetical protein